MAAPSEELAALVIDDTKRREQHTAYYAKRVELFQRFKARHDAEVEAAKQAAVPIKIVLPDGAGE